jgi:hypothetical protein
MSEWLERCRAFAEQAGLGPDATSPLQAFGGQEPTRPAPSFAALLEEARRVDAASAGIVRAATAEVDHAQARMFARRYEAVAALLEKLAEVDDEAKVLLVGLSQRTVEILADPRPVALRVRAAVDFYYSRAATLLHRRAGVPTETLEALVARAVWRTVRPGVEHAVIEGALPKGPMHANVLRVRRGSAHVEAVDCRDAHSHGADLAAVCAERGAVAAVSGGFFLYSEPDIAPPFERYDPVGLLVHRGSVLCPPVFHRGALLVTDFGLEVARVGPVGLRVVPPAGPSFHIDAVAPDHLPHGVVAWTRAAADVTPAHDGPLVALGRGAVVARSDGSPLPVPLAGLVLALPATSAGRALAAALPAGAPVRFELPPRRLGAVREAMAGGPLLVVDGEVKISMEIEDFRGSAPPVTFSHDETFDQNQLPRMSAGLTQDGDLVLTAVDGRNVERALGFTLHETGRLQQLLGCHVATNLDGGSSKRMVILGRVVDLPSTEVRSSEEPTPVRPVHSAILVRA